MMRADYGIDAGVCYGLDGGTKGRFDSSADSGRDGGLDGCADHAVSCLGKRRCEDEADRMIQVPALDGEHESWTALEAILQGYGKQTHSVIIIKEVINVNRRNDQIRGMVQNRDVPDSELPLIPAEMEPYQRKFICTHDWKPRKRSTGDRPSRKVRFTDCPFQFLAQVSMRDDGSWGITLKRGNFRHNHALAEAIYRAYPSVRQVPDTSSLMPGIELLVNAKAAPSSIYDFVRESSDHRVTMIDVRKIIARLRNSGKCCYHSIDIYRCALTLVCGNVGIRLSDDNAVAEALVNFNLGSPKNVSSVSESSRGDTAVISVTSAHMRTMFANFPEVLQMDCTHKTNKYVATTYFAFDTSRA